jgi:hypothetical protein
MVGLNCGFQAFQLHAKQGRPLPMGQPEQSEQLPPPPIHKNLQKKKKKAKLCNIVTAMS